MFECLNVMTVQNFEDLVIFQLARTLSKNIYDITKIGDFKNDFRFVQQIHASAGSVMDNVAEGFERQGNKEFINFLYIAKGSCGEVRSQLIRAYDVNFISEETFKLLYNDCKKLSAAILKLIQTLKASNVTGSRYANASNPSTINNPSNSQTI